MMPKTCSRPLMRQLLMRVHCQLACTTNCDGPRTRAHALGNSLWIRRFSWLASLVLTTVSLRLPLRLEDIESAAQGGLRVFQSA
jgi:hypothetical protein